MGRTKNKLSAKKTPKPAEKSPPDWQSFTRWVLVAAGIGLAVAVGIFVLLYFVVFPHADTPNSAWGLPDVITATATAIGGLTVGGVALIQVRKHKFLEFQAKNEYIAQQNARQVQLNERDIQLGEQLRRAIEHLGDKDHEHIRLGAIYEFKRLEMAVDLRDYDRDSIVRILSSFIESRMAEETKAAEQGEVDVLPPDIKAAAELASAIIKEEIERTAEKSTAEKNMRPPEYVFIAAQVISALLVDEIGTFFLWGGLNACNVSLSEYELKNAALVGAHLQGTGLVGARLQNTNLEWADLRGANLKFADLRGAHLEFADLRNARFNDNIRIDFDTIYDSDTQFDPGIEEKYFKGIATKIDDENDLMAYMEAKFT
ncbi:MAG: pentapeptide repeat-containing protein [Oscillospiraceae bacterium]|jgi:hypothetical protein|nr:pentapeptide repeat-containing protein [Oscillospiraceae bacterium]